MPWEVRFRPRSPGKSDQTPYISHDRTSALAEAVAIRQTTRSAKQWADHRRGWERSLVALYESLSKVDENLIKKLLV